MKLAYLPFALHYPGSAKAWEVLRRDVAGELKAGERRWLEDEGMYYVPNKRATLDQLKLAAKCAELEAERDARRRLLRAVRSREYASDLRGVLACVQPLMLGRPDMMLQEASDIAIQLLADQACSELESQLR